MVWTHNWCGSHTEIYYPVTHYPAIHCTAIHSSGIHYGAIRNETILFGVSAVDHMMQVMNKIDKRYTTADLANR